MPSASKHARTVLAALRDFLKHWLVQRRQKNLPCDSKSPALCFACHSLRDQLLGTHHAPKNQPTIIYTRHGHYITRQQPETRVQSKNNTVIVTYGEASPELLAEMLARTQPTN